MRSTLTAKQRRLARTNERSTRKRLRRDSLGDLMYRLASLQAELGHSQISITLDVYSHVMSGKEKDAADKLDAVLAPRGHIVAIQAG